MSSHPLRTSREVYLRLVYDPALDPADYVVGYRTRAGTIEELPVPRFVADGDIPWHRVVWFRTARHFVWHRGARYDAIFGSGDPSAEEPGHDLA